MEKFLVLLFSSLALMAVGAPVALATHPLDDQEDRGITNQPNPDPSQRAQCDDSNYGGFWESLDEEFWVCDYDFGLPEVPGSEGNYWHPEEPPPGWGDVAWSKRWDPVSIPGYTGVYMRLLERTEWLNPTHAGSCPNVTGGCKLHGGADINLIRMVSGADQPFMLNKTWFNHAMQLYVYNATTKAWELKQDTGWTMNGTSAPTYINRLTSTVHYGTAPYGAAWYYVRAWGRVWDGASWATKVYQDPRKADGTLDMVYDAKPGDVSPPPPKPDKPPKVKKPKGDDSSGPPAGGGPTP